MSSNYAVRLSNISKMYRMYEKPSHKLKEAMLRGLFRKNVSYHRSFWAINDINLIIPKGITFGLIGQNGSGKSTLLQIIAGVLQPTTGEREVNGRISALLELGAGFNGEFTGVENVFMYGSILGIPKAEIEKRFESIEEFAEIGEFIYQPVKSYSSGMYARLAFATAVNVDPDILIIDEALAVGDDLFQRRCYAKIEQFQKEGKTIIFVSHSLPVLNQLCQESVLMDGGKIIMQGNTNDVTNTYRRLISEREDEYRRRTANRKATPVITGGRAQGSREYRFGNGEAEITEFRITDREGNLILDNTLKFGDLYLLYVNVLFRNDVDNPMIGLYIKTMTGVLICATDNLVSENHIGPVSSGTLIEVVFSIPMNLRPDAYTFSFAVEEKLESGKRPIDMRVDAIILRVVGTKIVYGLIDNGMTASIHSSVKFDKSMGIRRES